MSSSAVAAPTSGGRGRSYFPLVILAVAAALAVAATQSRVKERERVRESPKERGIQYEDHVLAPTNLPRAVQLSGGTLRIYPHLYVPQTTMPARYYKSPKGYDGRTTRDRAPHDSAPRRWEAVDVGGYRIPDAMETQADGSEVLYELKCPSPWLVFGSGNPWAGKMQAAFGSQALAYVIWAKAGPKRRITYGFCGLAPKWAIRILIDLERRYAIKIEYREIYRSAGFAPAAAFVSTVMREALTGSALAAAEGLAPEQLLGAGFDAVKD